MAKKKESQECTVADLEYAVIFTFFFQSVDLVVIAEQGIGCSSFCGIGISLFTNNQIHYPLGYFIREVGQHCIGCTMFSDMVKNGKGRETEGYKITIIESTEVGGGVELIIVRWFL